MMTPTEPKSVPGWLAEDSTHPVVVSSRTRFARNLDSHPFPEKADRDEKQAVREEIFAALDRVEFNRNWNRIRIQELDQLEKTVLHERRLASDTLLEESEAALECSESEEVSILINEEDHIRINAFQVGLAVENSFDTASDIRDEFTDELSIASSSRWGFLTACPTNLGTGMRSSVLLHVPGLVLSESIDRVLKAVSNLGLTVRGFYGEGTQTQGYYLQLSNQVTMGQTEEELLSSLAKVTNRISEREQKARQQLLKQSDPMIEDKIWKAFGALRYARKMNRDQALRLLSLGRLGVSVDLLPSIPLTQFENLMVRIQPAHLQNDVGEKLSKQDRKIFRASVIRDQLGEYLDNTN